MGGSVAGEKTEVPRPLQTDASTDFLIIGAGFSGLVIAERLASAGWKCVVVDRREHLGGNAHDRTDAAGVLIHPYGPHYFRTNSQRVVDYLSRFTAWHAVAYTIKSHTRGRYWSFPINLNTFEEFLGQPPPRRNSPPGWKTRACRSTTRKTPRKSSSPKSAASSTNCFSKATRSNNGSATRANSTPRSAAASRSAPTATTAI